MIFAGTLIITYTTWQWIDPVVTLMIAGYILWMSFGEIGGVIRILMLGSPPETQRRQGDLGHRDNRRRDRGCTMSTSGKCQEHEAALDAHLGSLTAGRWGRRRRDQAGGDSSG